MRPKLLLLDEPCDKAKEILSEVFELEDVDVGKFSYVWTGLTNIEYFDGTVFCPCTGIDHINTPNVIYLDDEWKRGEGMDITSTAEHTISLILQLAKLKRMQIYNKKIAIIGYGRIGQMVDMLLFGFNPRVQQSNGVEGGWELHELLKQKPDIVTIHVPLNESTKGMIGKREFELMKDGTLLINTSRAEIVDENALIYALKTKGIYYANDFYMNYLDDVTEHPNVISTNHIGGNCIEAREATDVYIAKRAIEWWRSKNP